MSIPDEAVKAAYNLLFPYLAGHNWPDVKQRLTAALEAALPYILEEEE